MSVDDTSHCPRGVRCESCGAEHPDVVVAVRELGAGLRACLTLCPACAASLVPPPVTAGTAERLARQHEAHLRAARALRNGAR